MNAIASYTCFEDFHRFCTSFDVKDVIAAADEQGYAVGFEKEVYALAILRAVHNGDFGEDREATRKAISRLWQSGCCNGFNAATFNDVFQELFIHW